MAKTTKYLVFALALLIASVNVTALGAAGPCCQTGSTIFTSSATTPLEGTFQLTYIAGGASHKILLQFKQGDVAIMGCNYYKGTFQADPATGQFAITQDLSGASIFCTSDQDQRVADALKSSVFFTYDGINLVFFSSTRQQLLGLQISLGDIFSTSNPSTIQTTTTSGSLTINTGTTSGVFTTGTNLGTISSSSSGFLSGSASTGSSGSSNSGSSESSGSSNGSIGGTSTSTTTITTGSNGGNTNQNSGTIQDNGSATNTDTSSTTVTTTTTSNGSNNSGQTSSTSTTFTSSSSSSSQSSSNEATTSSTGSTGSGVSGSSSDNSNNSGSNQNNNEGGSTSTIIIDGGSTTTTTTTSTTTTGSDETQVSTTTVQNNGGSSTSSTSSSTNQGSGSESSSSGSIQIPLTGGSQTVNLGNGGSSESTTGSSSNSNNGDTTITSGSSTTTENTGSATTTTTTTTTGSSSSNNESTGESSTTTTSNTGQTTSTTNTVPVITAGSGSITFNSSTTSTTTTIPVISTTTETTSTNPVITVGGGSTSSSGSNSTTTIKNGTSTTTIVVVNPIKPEIQVITPIKPPVITVNPINPSTTVSTTSIKGSYNLVIHGIELTISQSKYTLIGCNTHTFTYKINRTGQVTYGTAGSTRKACSIDFDSYYLNAFKRIKTLIQYNQGFNALDQNGVVVLRFQPTDYKQKIGSNGQGSYKVYFPTVSLTIDDTSVSYQGCNINSASYSISGNKIKFDQFVGTLRACLFYDFDSLISKAFEFVNTWDFTNGELRFRSESFILLTAIRSTGSVIRPTIYVPIPLFNATQQKPDVTVVVTNSTTVINTTKPGSTSTPVIILPNIRRISLKGNYKFSIFSSYSVKLPIIVTTFDDEYLTFQGCNFVSLPYTAYDDGSFIILDGGSVTQKLCDIDNDDKYISFFRSVNRIDRKDGIVIFVQDNKPIANLTTSKVIQDAQSKSIAGTYSLDLSGLTVTVKNNNIYLEGCNSHTISFKSDSDGNVTFGSVSSTKKGCKNNNDNVYVKAITSCKKIVKQTDGMSFVGADGIERIRFYTCLFSPLSAKSPLQGQYRAKLTISNIKLTITSNSFTIEGCNKLSFSYNLGRNGQISFGKADSTKKACDIDYDSVILNSILEVREILFSGSGSIITFLDSQGSLIAKTDKYVAKPTIPVIVQPTKPQAKQFKFTSGSYIINYSRTKNIKQISATINDNKITISGCKSYTLKYTAYTDNTLKLQPDLTSVANSPYGCQTNNDDLFLVQLRAAETYSISKNVITFFDNSKKSYINFTVGKLAIPSAPAPSKNNTPSKTTTTKQLQVGLPFYCIFDMFSLPFYQQKKQNNIFDWFGLGPKIDEKPKTIAEAAVTNNKQEQPKSSSYSSGGLSGFFGSVFNVFNPLNWFGGSSRIQNSYDNYWSGDKKQSSYSKPASTSSTGYSSSSSSSSSSISTSSSSTPLTPVTLQGKYKLSLPKVDLQISKDSFTFKGCNSHRVPCSYRNNKIYFGKPVSTKFNCAADHAENIVRLLPSFATYQKNDNLLTFFNQNLQSVFTSSLKDNSKSSSKIYGDLFEGSYFAQLPDYNVDVKNNKFNFQGCRNNAVEYISNDYGFVNFNKQLNNHKSSCSSNADDYIVNYLRSGARIVNKDSKTYSIQDQYGNDLLYCSSVKRR